MERVPPPKTTAPDKMLLEPSWTVPPLRLRVAGANAPAAPETTIVPVPDFVMLLAPVPVTVPENVVEVLSAPTVSAPPLPRVTLPAPASEPMVSLLALTSNVAPLATTTAVVLARALLAPSCTVPALIMVAPE